VDHVSWNPGLLGLICLPEHTIKGTKRLYFVADIDEKGLYSIETDLISWSEAYYTRMPQLAEQSGKTTFATLNLDEVEK
jgi:hypothetical protein